MRRRREKFRVLVFFTVAAAAIMLPSSAPAVEIVINVRIEAANGAVTSSDGTVNCSGACVVRVPYGRVLTLRAAPAR